MAKLDFIIGMFESEYRSGGYFAGSSLSFGADFDWFIERELEIIGSDGRTSTMMVPYMLETVTYRYNNQTATWSADNPEFVNIFSDITSGGIITATATYENGEEFSAKNSVPSPIENSSDTLYLTENDAGLKIEGEFNLTNPAATYDWYIDGEYYTTTFNNQLDLDKAILESSLIQASVNLGYSIYTTPFLNGYGFQVQHPDIDQGFVNIVDSNQNIVLAIKTDPYYSGNYLIPKNGSSIFNSVKWDGEDKVWKFQDPYILPQKVAGFDLLSTGFSVSGSEVKYYFENFNIGNNENYISIERGYVKFVNGTLIGVYSDNQQDSDVLTAYYNFNTPSFFTNSNYRKTYDKDIYVLNGDTLKLTYDPANDEFRIVQSSTTPNTIYIGLGIHDNLKIPFYAEDGVLNLSYDKMSDVLGFGRDFINSNTSTEASVTEAWSLFPLFELAGIELLITAQGITGGFAGSITPNIPLINLAIPNKVNGEPLSGSLIVANNTSGELVVDGFSFDFNISPLGIPVPIIPAIKLVGTGYSVNGIAGVAKSSSTINMVYEPIASQLAKLTIFGTVNYQENSISGGIDLILIDELFFKASAEVEWQFDIRVAVKANVTILDLPGLRYTSDVNLSISFKESICIDIVQETKLGNGYSNGLFFKFSADGDLSNDYFIRYKTVNKTGLIADLLGAEDDFVTIGEKYTFTEVGTSILNPFGVSISKQKIGVREIDLYRSWKVNENLNDLQVLVEWENPASQRPEFKVLFYSDFEKTNLESIYTEDEFFANGIAVLEEWGTSASAIVLINRPKIGVWDVEIVDDSALGAVSFSATSTLSPSQILINDITITQESIATVDYTLTNPYLAGVMSFYIDDDKSDYDGYYLDSFAADASGSATLDLGGIGGGDFYLYAVFENEGYLPYTTYYDAPVTVSATSTEIASIAEDNVISYQEMDSFQGFSGTSYYFAEIMLSSSLWNDFQVIRADTSGNWAFSLSELNIDLHNTPGNHFISATTLESATVTKYFVVEEFQPEYFSVFIKGEKGNILSETEGQLHYSDGMPMISISNANLNFGSDILLENTYEISPSKSDYDHSIGISDVIAQLRHIVGLQELTGLSRYNSDIDDDGSVSISDVISNLRTIVGLQEPPTIRVIDSGFNDRVSGDSFNSDFYIAVKGDVDLSWQLPDIV